MRKIVSLLFLLVLTVSVSFAQSLVNVTGQVKDEKGEPVAYATVKVKKGKNSVSADEKGFYKIKVKEGSTIVVSGAGITETETVVSGSQTVYNLTVAKSQTELQEVVVGALGINRSAKSTPYAVQQISGERLTQTRETDVTTGLAGKIAGIQVLGQSGGKLGNNGTVRIRGASGLNAANAIYVVDGTILTNPADINSDDVASINVLKGPSATALYGQRAEGGVIVITTKKAKKGTPLQVNLSSSAAIDVVGMLPPYQNKFGGGIVNAFKKFSYNKAVHPADWATLDGQYFPADYTDDSSWGPEFDGRDYAPWYAWIPGSKYTGKTAKWTAQPNNIRNYYAKGSTVNTNISVSKGGSFYTFRLGYNNISKKGIVPYSSEYKNVFSGQVTIEPIKNVTIAFNANYSNDKLNGDFNDGYSNQGSGSFNQWFHRDLDTKIEKELVDLKTPIGTYASWNLGSNPNSASFSNNIYKGNYWANHYTWYKYYSQQQNRDRLFGNVSLSYKFLKDFTIKGTYYFNNRSSNSSKKMPFDLANTVLQSSDYDVPRGTSPFPTSYGLYNFYKHYNSSYNEYNTEFILKYTKQVGAFNVDAFIGANFLQWKSKDSTQMTSGGLKVKDVYDINNSAGTVYRQGRYLSQKKVQSFYAKATIGFKDFLYVDLSIRNDASSVLPKANNGYTYPSAGASFVFTNFVKKYVPELSYGKLRAGWAQIGSDGLSPYALNLTYFNQPIKYLSNGLTTVPNTSYDPNIKPTINSAYEAGIDLRFFKDRLGLGLTLFTENKKNDIVSSSVSSSSGFTALVFNAGSIHREGAEVQIDLKPILTKNFIWDVSVNWSATNVIVKKVSETQNYVNYGNDAFGVTQIVNQEGQKWGQLQGLVAIKKVDGVPVLNNDGTYATTQNVNFGSILPDYTGGVFTGFTYKNLTLSASFDYQHGAKFFSLSHYFGTTSGLYDVTAATNDKGVNVRSSVASGGGVHVFGLDATTLKPVDYYVEATKYFKQNSTSTIPDLDILSSDYFKCREISLAYDFNLKKFPSVSKYLHKVNLAVFARNPFSIYNGNKYVDGAEVSGGNTDYQFSSTRTTTTGESNVDNGGSGFENGQIPGTRSYGVTVKLGF